MHSEAHRNQQVRVVRQEHRQLTRITEIHFPEKIQDVKRKKCVVYPSSRERFRKTWIQWWCPNCKIRLCVEGCFSGSQLIIITGSVVLLASIVSILVVRSNLSIKFYHPTTSLSRNLFVMQGNSWNCTTKYIKWTRCCTGKKRKAGKVYIFISEGNSILWFLKHVSKYLEIWD